MTKLIKKIIKKEKLKVKKKELTYIIERGQRKIFKTVCLLRIVIRMGNLKNILTQMRKWYILFINLLKDLV